MKANRLLVAALFLLAACLSAVLSSQPAVANYVPDGDPIEVVTCVFTTNPPGTTRVHESHSGTLSMGVDGDPPDQRYNFSVNAQASLRLDAPPNPPNPMYDSRVRGHLRVVYQKGQWMNWSFDGFRLPTKHVTGSYRIQVDGHVNPSNWTGTGSTPFAKTFIDTLHPCVDDTEGWIVSVIQPINYTPLGGEKTGHYFKEEDFDTCGTAWWTRVLVMVEAVIEIDIDSDNCINGSGHVEAQANATKVFYCFVPPPVP